VVVLEATRGEGGEAGGAAAVVHRDGMSYRIWGSREHGGEVLR
jgi:hypothetical protein